MNTVFDIRCICLTARAEKAYRDKQARPPREALQQSMHKEDTESFHNEKTDRDVV